MFSTERSTVVTEQGTRRDARSNRPDGDGDAAAVPAGGRRRGTVLDLPEIDEQKRDRDGGGELVN